MNVKLMTFRMMVNKYYKVCALEKLYRKPSKNTINGILIYE